VFTKFEIASKVAKDLGRQQTDRFRRPVVGDSDKSLGLGARLKCRVP